MWGVENEVTVMVAVIMKMAMARARECTTR